MIRRRSRALGALALIAVVISTARADPADTPEAGLQPYQMVRSLQLVQDRIAGGDHAALPMQRKLLEMIDTRFRSADNSSFTDRRNIHALVIYAVSGGNPSTIAEVLARLDVAEADRQAVAGVLGYLLGDIVQARAAMATVDLATQPSEVAAFLSLVKGSVVAGENPSEGLELLDKARLLGPGTLIEEAALRRTVTLAVSTHDVARFLSTSEQYARRYLRSPYASQFAEVFVSGIIALREHDLDLSRIEQAIEWMTPEQAKTVYLRLARRGAINVDAALLEFAARKASEYSDIETEEADPRSELYSSISSVTSETVEDVLERLSRLDPSRLSASDRALLSAAKTVANEVIAPVSANRTPAETAPVLDTDLDLDLDLDLEVGSEAENETALYPLEETATDNLVSSARSKLEAIDKLLEETNR